MAEVRAVSLRDAVVAALPDLRLGPWSVDVSRISAIRFHHGNTLIFSRLHRVDDAARETSTCDAVIKISGRARGSIERGALELLWDAGFQPPAIFQVPPVLGCSADDTAIAEAQVGGVSWGDLLLPGAASACNVADRAAGWLLALQRVSPRQRKRTRPVPDTDPELWATALVQCFPSHGARLRNISRHLDRRLHSDSSPRVLSHGDFHPDNILMGSGVTFALDLEAFGVRPASFDVGSAIGQLLTMSHFRLGRFGPGARAALRFWTRYALDGQAGWRDVSPQVVRILLKNLHYAFATPTSNAEGHIDPWVKVMEDCLESGGATPLEGPPDW